MDCNSYADSHKLFEDTFEHCAVGLAHVCPKGSFIRVNTALSQFLGYEKSTLTTMMFQQLTPEPYLQEDVRLVQRILNGSIATYTLEKQYVHANGHIVWGKVTVSLVRNDNGQPDYFIAVVEDIDEKKSIENELFQAEALFEKIVAAFAARTFVWVADPMISCLHYVNKGFTNIFGRSDSELRLKPDSFLDHIYDADRERVVETYSKVPLTSWDLEYRIIDKSGNLKYIHDRGMPLYNAVNDQVLVVGTADDITYERAHEHALLEAISKLEHLSKTDPLTGLSNRREMFCQLDDEIQRIKRGQKPSTLVYLDLNNFKEVNDRYGHRAGDKVLVAFSKAINNELRVSDKFARLGGDEFVLLLYSADSVETEIFFNRISQLPFHIEFDDDMSTSLTFSYGWVSWNSTISSAQCWVDAADEAMYQRKRQRYRKTGV